jgi:hypothetical protein
MKLYRALGFLVTVSVLSTAAVISAQSRRSTLSEVVKECDGAAGCVPDSTSLVVVYVSDAAGVAIAGMTVAVAEESSAAVSARTDRDGMVAVSVKPGRTYSVRSTEPGFTPLTTATRIPVGGGMRVLRVVMRIAPIE